MRGSFKIPPFLRVCELTGQACETNSDCPGFVAASMPGIVVINAFKIPGNTIGNGYII